MNRHHRSPEGLAAPSARTPGSGRPHLSAAPVLTMMLALTIQATSKTPLDHQYNHLKAADCKQSC